MTSKKQAKKQTKPKTEQKPAFESCSYFYFPDCCFWEFEGPLHPPFSTVKDYYRGPTPPDWIRRTETLDELSELVNDLVEIDAPGNEYSAEAIERMVRDRVIRFCREGKTLPELPDRDLQSWQEWFAKLKATPVTIDNGGGNGKKEQANKDEANVKARKLLKIQPDLTVRELADKIPCSLGLADQLPAYQAVLAERKKGRKPKKTRLSKKMLSITGTGKKDGVLDALIAEQAGEQKEDDRQTKIFVNQKRKR